MRPRPKIRKSAFRRHRHRGIGWLGSARANTRPKYASFTATIDGGTYVYNIPLHNLQAAGAPTVNDDADDNYAPGSVWIDKTGDDVYTCVDATVGAAVWVLCNPSPGGSGTVTDFSAGNLSPLFTTSEATTTTTPALSFTQIAQVANTIFVGPASGADANPTFRAMVTADITNSIVTYAKIQNVSATDRLLGRSTAGAGVVEEITCTAAGRTIISLAVADFAGTVHGLVPGGSGGVSTVVLAGDGTWVNHDSGGIAFF